jgi:3-dehydroquinate synthase
MQMHAPVLNNLPSDRCLTIEASESAKSIEGFVSLAEWLISKGARRSSTLVGVGGGITQDLVTFTAGVYYRGMRYVLAPTTLLSMCDSSIGSKCGINFAGFKNQLGVIHAPKGVFAFLPFLLTLRDEDWLSGYGELVKLAVTNSEAHFDQLAAVPPSLKSVTIFAPLIRNALETKKRIIEADEYEADLRRILNYGHTFGHAIETASNYSIPHGVAVMLGMLVVNDLEVVDSSDAFRFKTRSLIESVCPQGATASIDPDRVVDLIWRDKKVVGTQINLILARDFGSLGVHTAQIDDGLRLKAVRAMGGLP